MNRNTPRRGPSTHSYAARGLSAVQASHWQIPGPQEGTPWVPVQPWAQHALQSVKHVGLKKRKIYVGVTNNTQADLIKEHLEHKHAFPIPKRKRRWGTACPVLSPPRSQQNVHRLTARCRRAPPQDGPPFLGGAPSSSFHYLVCCDLVSHYASSPRKAEAMTGAGPAGSTSLSEPTRIPTVDGARGPEVLGGGGSRLSVSSSNVERPHSTMPGTP